MALIYSGKKRSLTFTIFRNGVELDDSPFDGRQAFTFVEVTYTSWSNVNLGTKSYAEYSARLLAFESYLESLYPGLDFTNDIDTPNYEPYMDSALCVTPATTTTSTSTTSTTTTTTTEWTVPPPSVKVLMNIDSDVKTDYSITEINYMTYDTLVGTISGATVITQYPFQSWLTGSGALVISILGANPTIGGYIRITDSLGYQYTWPYTGAGDYTFAYPAIVVNSITQIIIELNIKNTKSTTTSTSTSTTTTTTTNDGSTTTSTTSTSTTSTTSTSTTTTTTEPVVHYNEVQSDWFNKQCVDPLVGSAVEYIIDAGTVFSYVSVYEANLTAWYMVQSGGQANADNDPNAYCYDPNPPVEECDTVTITNSLTTAERTSGTTAHIQGSWSTTGATEQFWHIDIYKLNPWTFVELFEEFGTTYNIYLTDLDPLYSYAVSMNFYTIYPACALNGESVNV